MRRGMLHTWEPLGPVYFRLPLLNDLLRNIGYTFRLRSSQLPHCQSRFAFLRCRLANRSKAEWIFFFEILTLRIPSVTFFSFNKARTLRVSYIINDIQQKKVTRFTHKRNIPARWQHFATVSLIFSTLPLPTSSGPKATTNSLQTDKKYFKISFAVKCSLF